MNIGIINFPNEDSDEFPLTTLVPQVSGDLAEDIVLEIGGGLSPSLAELDVIEEYLQRRIDELRTDCRAQTPWVFICSMVLLEYLASLVMDRSSYKTDLEFYVDFLRTWLAQARPEYITFEYEQEHDGTEGKTKTDLPLQMYGVLRSAMVHSFSLIPDNSLWTAEQIRKSTSPRKYARRGSIVLCHASSGYRHLSRSPKQDAACFVAEDFVEDINNLIRIILERAQQDDNLSVYSAETGHLKR